MLNKEGDMLLNSTRNLKLLSFNVEGLDSMLLDPNFLDMINKHDICILTETMRKDDSKLNLNGFWDFSLVRPKEKKAGRFSGGITILVKSPLRKGIKIAHSSEGIVWLRLFQNEFKMKNDLFICAAYIPPQNANKNLFAKTDYFNDLLNTTDQFMKQGNVILAGDFNSRIGVDNSIDTDNIPIPILEEITPSFINSTPMIERSACDQIINQHGKKLNKICNNLSLHVANGRTPGDLLGNFTCFTNRGTSTVDLVIADIHTIDQVRELKVLPPEFTSVHAPISVKLKCEFSEPKNTTTTIPLPPKIIWDPEKVPALREALLLPKNNQTIEELKNTLENRSAPKQCIDKCLRLFDDLLIGETKKLMKTTKNKPQTANKPRKGFTWYNKECTSLKKRLQNQARMLAKNPRDPYIRGQYNTAKKQYRKTVKLAKQTYEVEAIQTLQTKASNPKEFWAFLKDLGKNKEIGENNSPTAEEWLKHFTALNSADPSSKAADSERINNLVRSLAEKLASDNTTNPTSQLTRNFCREELERGMKSPKAGKAVATDLVSNDILKATSDIISPLLVALFNKILTYETFPEDWSLGIILPLFKSGDTNDTNCYRGITINSCLSKLFMLLMNNRLQDFCNQHNIIHFNQIGFTKDFRPGDHVFTMKTLIDKSISQKKSLHVCFVDFRKAYDTVWRDGLFTKLLAHNIDIKFVRLLRNIYATSSLAVKTKHGRSNIFESHVGLKQGCNLSPLLFNIFINDLLTEINIQLNDSPTLEGMPINGLMYADDLVLMSESEEGLQELLNILHSYTERWFLQVNKSKTKYMRISKNNKDPLVPMKLGEVVLENTEEYCYLGTMFTSNGSLNKAGKVLHDKAVKAMYGLIRKINKHKTCSPKLMLELFDKMILPIAMYNSEVWGTTCFPVNEKNNDFFDVAKNNKNPVEDIQVRFCKRLLGVNDKATNWAVISECGRLPTATKMMAGMVSFWTHLNNSKSPILRAALQTSANLSTAKNCRSWFSYLVRILRTLDMEHILYTSDIQEVNNKLRSLKRTIHLKALHHWNTMHNKKSTERTKLEVFCRVKTKPDLSQHLVCPLSFKERRAMSKFRTSTHNLPVETFRYKGIDDRAQRLCPLCNQGIGDEPHYLIECDFHIFPVLRTPLFTSICEQNPHFSTMSKIEKCTFLLNNPETHSLSQVGKFCHEIMEVFRVINEGARSK